MIDSALSICGPPLPPSACLRRRPRAQWAPAGFWETLMIDNCLLERWGQPVCRGDVERGAWRRVGLGREEAVWSGWKKRKLTSVPARLDPPPPGPNTTRPLCKTLAPSPGRGLRAREERSEDNRKRRVCVKGKGQWKLASCLIPLPLFWLICLSELSSFALIIGYYCAII